MSIVINDLVAGYIPDVNIVDGVSVAVKEATMTTIIGPNGSGKSTLLKAVVGLLPLRAGHITIDGTRCENIPVDRRITRHGVGYVPQSQNVFGSISIENNLWAGGHAMRRRERIDRANELLDLYPALGSRRHARADTLSGGERQLLAVCRALMPSPRTLLLDEPSAGLSPRKVQELFEIIANIRDRDRISILIVEQNAAQSLEVSDAGIVLVQGRIAIADSARGLLANPEVANLFLGGLVTSRNETA